MITTMGTTGYETMYCIWCASVTGIPFSSFVSDLSNMKTKVAIIVICDGIDPKGNQLGFALFSILCCSCSIPHFVLSFHSKTELRTMGMWMWMWIRNTGWCLLTTIKYQKQLTQFNFSSHLIFYPHSKLYSGSIRNAEALTVCRFIWQ